MAIGDIVHNSFESYVDEYTGAVVERLTDPSVTCHHMYFYAHMTTRDGGKLLYAPQIAGERQIYCMDLATGDAVQLTERALVWMTGVPSSRMMSRRYSTIKVILSGVRHWMVPIARGCTPRRRVGRDEISAFREMRTSS